MRRRIYTAIAVTVVAGACVAAITVAPSASPERVAAALLLVLALPGYALSELIAAGRGRTRLLLVPALSVAAAIIDSAGLQLLGARLDRVSWAVSLAVVATISIWGSLLRQRSPVAWRSPPVRNRATIALVGAGVGVAILLSGAAFVTNQSVSRRERDDRFTQLSALPAGGVDGAAMIGIYNHEGQRQVYTLDVFTNHHRLSSNDIGLDAGGRWQDEVAVPLACTTVRVTLSSGSPSRPVYRWVELHLPARASLDSRARKAC